MRIIAGDFKGHRLKTVKGWGTRPTADKVKGAIFNVLGSRVLNSCVLDVFAGTGSLALESLSRGAKEAVLIEKNNAAFQVLKENIKLLRVEEKVSLYKADALKLLNSLRGQEFDLVFLDPPYQKGYTAQILKIFQDSSLLQADGVIIIETASNEELMPDLYPLEVRTSKEYGDTKIWFLQQIDKTKSKEG